MQRAHLSSKAAYIAALRSTPEPRSVRVLIDVKGLKGPFAQMPEHGEMLAVPKGWYESYATLQRYVETLGGDPEDFVWSTMPAAS